MIDMNERTTPRTFEEFVDHIRQGAEKIRIKNLSRVAVPRLEQSSGPEVRLARLHAFFHVHHELRGVLPNSMVELPKWAHGDIIELYRKGMTKKALERALSTYRETLGQHAKTQEGGSEVGFPALNHDAIEKHADWFSKAAKESPGRMPVPPVRKRQPSDIVPRLERLHGYLMWFLKDRGRLPTRTAELPTAMTNDLEPYGSGRNITALTAANMHHLSMFGIREPGQGGNEFERRVGEYMSHFENQAPSRETVPPVMLNIRGIGGKPLEDDGEETKARLNALFAYATKTGQPLQRAADLPRFAITELLKTFPKVHPDQRIEKAKDWLGLQ